MFLLSPFCSVMNEHACLSHLKQPVTTEENSQAHLLLELCSPHWFPWWEELPLLPSVLLPSGCPSCSSLPSDLRTHSGPLETEPVTREFWAKGVWGCSLRRCTSKEVKGQDWADGESDLQCINSSCWGPSLIPVDLHWESWEGSCRHSSGFPLRQLLGWAALCTVVPCNWGQLPMQMGDLCAEWEDWSYSRDLGEPQICPSPPRTHNLWLSR